MDAKDEAGEKGLVLARRPRVKVEVEFTLFDQNIDPDTLAEAVFDLLGADENDALGDVSVDGYDITLRPTETGGGDA